MTAPHRPPGHLPSTRDRLLLAFADLASYGIEAHPALGTDPDTTRMHLRDAILAQYPQATGSYIFWTTPDDHAFDHNGELRHPLTLHHSGAEVARATHASLAQVGLRATAAEPPATLSIPPHPNQACTSPDSKGSARAIPPQT